MEILMPFIKTAHIAVGLAVIFFILIQPGGSDELGTVFGGGSSESVFGAGGATPFLAKATRVLAAFFVLTSLVLGYMSFSRSTSSVVGDFVEIPAENQSVEAETAAAPENPPDAPAETGTEKPLAETPDGPPVTKTLKLETPAETEVPK